MVFKTGPSWRRKPTLLRLFIFSEKPDEGSVTIAEMDSQTRIQANQAADGEYRCCLSGLRL